MNPFPTPSIPQPAQALVPYDAFLQLYNQVQQLTEEVLMLRQATVPEWLNRQQAMDYLQCSETKLWQLQQRKEIEFTYNGRSPLFKFSSCQAYLQNRSVNQKDIQHRLAEILATKKK